MHGTVTHVRTIGGKPYIRRMFKNWQRVFTTYLHHDSVEITSGRCEVEEEEAMSMRDLLLPYESACYRIHTGVEWSIRFGLHYPAWRAAASIEDLIALCSREHPGMRRATLDGSFTRAEVACLAEYFSDGVSDQHVRWVGSPIEIPLPARDLHTNPIMGITPEVIAELS